SMTSAVASIVSSASAPSASAKSLRSSWPSPSSLASAWKSSSGSGGGGLDCFRFRVATSARGNLGRGEVRRQPWLVKVQTLQGAQTPSLQERPPGHASPHSPQFRSSLSKSTHPAGAQQVSPPLHGPSPMHEQAPPRHKASPAQSRLLLQV